MPIALTIAGSDSGGGAGIQADLKTFAAHGVYGTSVITAVTAQNTRGVYAFDAISATLVTAQIAAVASDLAPHAVKTGMLANAAIVEAVAAAIDQFGLPSVVVDPVMVAKSGDRLLDDDAIAAVKSHLLQRALVVTPNVPEAEALTNVQIATDMDRREAATRLIEMGARAVIIKGGHFPSDDISDLLYDGSTFTEFRGERVPGRHTHGTGCTFAAALAAQLALGRSLTEAIPLVQAYIAGAIRNAPGLGSGNGPVQHFWAGP